MSSPNPQEKRIHTKPDTGRLVDTASYWLMMIATYLIEGALWYYPFKEKVFSDGMIAPAGIKHQFAGSLIASFPGTSVAWGILGVLEGLVVLGLAVSLVTGEFLPSRRKPILLSSLMLSLGVFGLLIFGNSMTSQFDAVGGLFTYVAATGVLAFLVVSLPPYRSGSWLGDLVRRES